MSMQGLVGAPVGDTVGEVVGEIVGDLVGGVGAVGVGLSLAIVMSKLIVDPAAPMLSMIIPVSTMLPSW
jgi:hypothetical protein